MHAKVCNLPLGIYLTNYEDPHESLIRRYPVAMDSNVHWPAGAQPWAHLMQQHDKDLLCNDLDKGRLPGTAMESPPSLW